MQLEQALAEARVRKSLPGPRVRRLLRQEAGLTQRDVAELLGVTETAVSRWEHGERYPRRPVLTAYAHLLTRLADKATEVVA